MITLDDESPKEENKKEGSQNTKIGCIIFVILLVLLCVWLGSCARSCSSEDEEKADEPDAISAYYMSHQFMEKQLKAPSTAKYPRYDENFVKDLGDGRYTVDAYVDAENSFGAMIRTNYTCTLKYAGDDKWTLEEIHLDE